MTALGTSTDPRALVPGAPEVVEAEAAALTGHGRRLEQVGHDLRAVDVAGWHGDAGARFAGAWAAEPPKWLRVADTAGLVAGSLSGYAGTLRWAQAQAATAIELWERARVETERAAAAHAAAHAAARAAEARGAEARGAEARGAEARGAEAAGPGGAPGAGEARTAATGHGAAGAGPVPPFVDPGEALRREAEDLLARARDRVRQAGDEAERVITGSGLGRPLALPGTLRSTATSVSGPSTGLETSGPEFDAAEGEYSLGELEARAHLFDAEAAGTVDLSGGTVLAATGSAGAGADAAMSAAAGRDGLSAELTGSLGTRAATRADLTAGVVHGHARGEAFVGAEGTAGLAVTRDRVGVGAEGLLGSEVAAGFGADVGGVGVGVQAEAWAGLGGQLDLGYEFVDGKFHLRGHAGAAVGVGGSAGLDVTVDPEVVERTIMAAADTAGRGLDGAGAAVAEGADDVAEAVRDLGDRLGL